MNDDKKDCAKPDVLDEDQPDGKYLTKGGGQKPIAEVFTAPASLTIINRINRRRIESYTEVVKAESVLMDALGGHAKAKSRLKDIEIEIEADQIDRRNRLAEAKRKEKLTGKEDKLAELDVDLQIAEKAKRLAELTQSPAEEKTKTKTDEESHTLKLEKLRRQNRYLAEENAVKKFGEFCNRREIEKECERLKQEILKDRKLDDLSEQEKQEIEDIEDARAYALDRL